MGIPQRGDLVVVTFPFSDLSGSRLRPALVVGSADSGDFILCQLTSKSYHGDGILIDPKRDVANGSLRAASYVRPLKLFTANSRLIKGTIGNLSRVKLETVVREIVITIDTKS